MKRRTKAVIIVVLLVLVLLAWAPWITDEYAIQKVIGKLGGPTTPFNYLGEEMTVNDIPTYVLWFPFVKAVYFPSEAVFLVTFYGQVI